MNNQDLVDTLTKQASSLQDLADDLTSLKSDVWDVSLGVFGPDAIIKVIGPDCQSWGEMRFLEALEHMLDDDNDLTKQVKLWLEELTAAQEILANYLPPQLTK